MRSKKYPLDPLVRLREERAKGTARELAAAITTREQAEALRLAKEAERARVAEETRRAAGSEAEALARGELSAADLQRQGAWSARTHWEDEARAREITTALEREAGARKDEEQARGKVASAEAETKVVVEHRGRWTAAGERAAQAKDEDEAAEVWRAR